MVCDVVCMIGILNLVNLSERGLLCVLVGREIDLWIMGIVGVFFLSLFDECILRAFFQVFDMKHLGFFRLLRECSMYLDSSS